MRFASRSVSLGFVFAALLAAGLIGSSSVARAADGDQPTYELGLYVWGASVAGDVDYPRVEGSANIPFSDLFENLNLALMARGRANFGKFSVVFDGEYLDLETDREERTVRIGELGIPARVSAKVELVEYILELNGGYEVFDLKGPFSTGPADERSTRGEIYLGARYMSVKPEIEIRIGGGERNLGEWQSWVDGLVGARLMIDLSRTVVLGIQGDVGGFNIGNSNDLAWSQITSLSWRFSDSMRLHLGYKFLDIRREVGDKRLDLQMRGPFIASSVHF